MNLCYLMGIMTSCMPTKLAIQLILLYETSIQNCLHYKASLNLFKIWFRWYQLPKWLELVNERSETSSIVWPLFLIFINWSWGDVQVVFIGKINLFHAPHTCANSTWQLQQSCLFKFFWSESLAQGVSITVSVYIYIYLYLCIYIYICIYTAFFIQLQ